MRDHNYFVYILTNSNRTVLYTGVTNNLEVRLLQHRDGLNGLSFTKRYNCYFLVFYERFQYIDDAIGREKQIKGWSRAKKNALIESDNKTWRFLNDDVVEK